jgi:ligand-binding sensor domain-containing protein
MPDGLVVGEEHDWQKIDHTAGLRGVAYTAFEDRQHSLWIGMEGRGLVQWRGYREWENYSTTSGLASESVYEIVPSQAGPSGLALKEVCCAASGRASASGGSWLPAWRGFLFTPCAASDGALWLSTKTRGVARFDVHTGKVKWFGEAQGLNKVVFTLCFDHSNGFGWEQMRDSTWPRCLMRDSIESPNCP